MIFSKKAINQTVLIQWTINHYAVLKLKLNTLSENARLISHLCHCCLDCIKLCWYLQQTTI